MSEHARTNISEGGMPEPRAGTRSIDPSENVKALTEAANVRQDDLRELNDRRIDAEIRVIQTQVQCAKDMILLRSEHNKEIRLLESDRLDKIRQVDVLAGNTAADRALVAIQTLATSQAAAAETLRSMVTNTASTIAAQTSETVSGLTGRIAALEKSSYEGAGKQAYADPMLAELVTEMKRVVAAGAGSAGQSQGAKNLWGYIVAAAVLMFGFITTAIAVIGFLVVRR